MGKNSSKEIKIEINPRLYPLEAIYASALLFLEENYLRLDGNLKDKVIVFLEPKNRKNQKKAKNLKKEFLNQLLNNTLRIKIAKQNKKLRETILNTVLFRAISKYGKNSQIK